MADLVVVLRRARGNVTDPRHRRIVTPATSVAPIPMASNLNVDPDKIIEQDHVIQDGMDISRHADPNEHLDILVVSGHKVDAPRHDG